MLYVLSIDFQAIVPIYEESLQGFKLHNLTHVPDQLNSISLPQQWDKPRGTKIKPVPVEDVVVARPLENRKRKPVVCQLDLNEK